MCVLRVERHPKLNVLIMSLCRGGKGSGNRGVWKGNQRELGQETGDTAVSVSDSSIE